MLVKEEKKIVEKGFKMHKSIMDTF